MSNQSRAALRMSEEIIAVVELLKVNPCPVMTPAAIASKTGMTYARTIKVLDTAYQMQRRQPKMTRLLGGHGSQYQTYYWSVERCKAVDYDVE